jgi:hypothetical protein
MKYTNALGWLLAALAALPGCTTELEEDEPLNSLASSLVADNALTANALTANALTANALAAIQDPNPGGELARDLLRYTVGCALSASQSFTFSWTDALGALHKETYPGLLGLASGWASGPLDKTGQQMVSACLAARTNWYGVSVTISVRSVEEPLRTMVRSSELAAYPNIEGAFWGNLFAPTPALYTCYNEQTAEYSRSLQRDCAAGHVDSQGGVETCGSITIVGRCQDACKAFATGGQFYPECTSNKMGAGYTRLVITTALP